MLERDHPTYRFGARAVVVLRFYSVATGALADPTSFVLRIQRRHGRVFDPVVTYTQASLGVTNESTGVWHVTLPEFVQNSAWGKGTYIVECDGDGTVESGYKSWFKVGASGIL